MLPRDNRQVFTSHSFSGSSKRYSNGDKKCTSEFEQLLASTWNLAFKETFTVVKIRCFNQTALQFSSTHSTRTMYHVIPCLENVLYNILIQLLNFLSQNVYRWCLNDAEEAVLKMSEAWKSKIAGHTVVSLLFDLI